MALDEGSAERFFNVYAPFAITFLMLGISAFSTLYAPHPSRPIRTTCCAFLLVAKLLGTTINRANNRIAQVENKCFMVYSFING